MCFAAVTRVCRRGKPLLSLGILAQLRFDFRCGASRRSRAPSQRALCLERWCLVDVENAIASFARAFAPFSIENRQGFARLKEGHLGADSRFQRERYLAQGVENLAPRAELTHKKIVV